MKAKVICGFLWKSPSR